MAGTRQRSILPKAHLEAIGAVSAYWSLVELILGEAIIEATRLTADTARCFTSHMGATQRLEALLSLVHEIASDSATEKEIIKIDNAIRRGQAGQLSVQAARNTVIHSYWERTPTSKRAIRFTVRARGKLHVSFVGVTAEEIWDVAEMIKAIAERLENWHLQSLRPLCEETLSASQRTSS